MHLSQKLNDELRLPAAMAQRIRYTVKIEEHFPVGCVPVQKWEFEKGTVGNKGSA